MQAFSLDLFVRLLCGLLCGVLIGLDRNLRGKAAGARTLGLVSLGAATAVCLVTVAGHPPDAMSRVLQGLLTGIGFLGVGVISRHSSDDKPQGLTTAAAIWLAAIIGAACGAGYFAIVAMALGLGLVLLLVGGRFERTLHRRLLHEEAGLPPTPKVHRNGGAHADADGQKRQAPPGLDES
ncbi:MgtC/SapB family protein [Cupriavidus sp. 2TAF22]|uniref:MgtC/SapB family protein n=1 Tax=unclassified Cupriavidus TaxID=2640874 RepID=UPI003F9069BA